MTRTIHAVYEKGVLKPLEDPGLREHQRVVIELRAEPDKAREDPLRRWREVYEDLSEEEITQVEAVALDRSRFMPQRP